MDPLWGRITRITVKRSTDTDEAWEYEGGASAVPAAVTGQTGPPGPTSRLNAFLTAVAFLVLVAVAAYVLHRLGLQHATDRGVPVQRPRPGRRGPPGPRRREPGAWTQALEHHGQPWKRGDNSGLRVFLDVSGHAAGVQAFLLLHHPSPHTERLLTDGTPSAGLTSAEAPQGTGRRTESAGAPVESYAGRAPRRPVSPQDHARSRCR